MSCLSILFFHWMKETIMNTVDMMIHVHPKLDALAKANLERKLLGQAGVDCALFNDHAPPQSLVVTYDADTIDRMEILRLVRVTDPEATTMGC